MENSLHWVLDIHFREDASTANADTALANLALLRKIAFNFTKLNPAMTKKTTDDLNKLIFMARKM